jgi:hypothetical protein
MRRATVAGRSCIAVTLATIHNSRPSGFHVATVGVLPLHATPACYNTYVLHQLQVDLK